MHRVICSRTYINSLTSTKRYAFTGLRSLSTFDKHKDVFDAFGISKTKNKGVFHGEWKGSGPIVPSYNPVNNEVIAEVITVSPIVSIPHNEIEPNYFTGHYS